MTLDEAIAHHEWAAENSQGEVRAEHEQYVKWLGLAKVAPKYAISQLQEAARIVIERNELRRENGRLRAENANLRELAESLLPDAMENVCFKSYWCDKKDWQTCNDKSCGNHFYVEFARELGVEV